ncbi:hypothetical protein [Tabrizicola sp.]|uniref:hypothetical protein n=1 Tax=Tabrizicola sp. TaxID=2005166 RepID=UPI003F37D167
MSYQFNQSANRSPAPPAGRPLWVKVLGYLTFFFPLVGAALSLFMLRNYLPSQDWLQTSAPIAMVCGAVTALLCALAVSTGFRYQAQETGKAIGPVTRFIVVLGGMFLVYLSVGELVHRGVPAVLAMSYGTTVEHDYIVERTSEQGSRRCRRAVYVEGPSLSSRLCDMPFRFTEELAPAMPVTFIGKGTSMGLFVEDFRKL